MNITNCIRILQEDKNYYAKLRDEEFSKYMSNKVKNRKSRDNYYFYDGHFLAINNVLTLLSLFEDSYKSIFQLVEEAIMMGVIEDKYSSAQKEQNNEQKVKRK